MKVYMFRIDPISEEIKDFFSIIDLINFVQKVSPRLLLMINPENDVVIVRITNKMLYQRADEPKQIIWHPSRHRNLPIDKVYPAGIEWIQKHL